MEILFSYEFVFLRIYLLNYTVKILSISLVVVFHQTSSVSVLYFIVPTCQRTQFVIRYCYIHFTNIIQKIFSRFQISKKYLEKFSKLFFVIISKIKSKNQIKESNQRSNQIKDRIIEYITYVIMVGFEPTQPRVTYFLSLTS